MSDNIKTLGGMPVGGTFLMEVGSKTVRATPFGAKETIGEPVTVMDMETVDFFREGGVALAELSKDVPAEEGDIVKLTVDNKTWEERLKVDTQDAEALRYMGNLHMLFADAVDTEEGYLLVLAENGAGNIILDDAAGVKSVSLEYRKVGAEAVTMPKEMLPEALQFGESVEKEQKWLAGDTMLNLNFFMQERRPFIFKVDGTEYELTPKEAPYSDWDYPGKWGNYVGKISLDPVYAGKGLAEDDVPFLVFCYEEDQGSGPMLLAVGEAEAVTLEAVCEQVATVTPISAEYLPEIPVEKLPESHQFGDTVTLELVNESNASSYGIIEGDVYGGYLKLNTVILGDTYVVTVDGTSYEGVARYNQNDDGFEIFSPDYLEAPFYLYWYASSGQGSNWCFVHSDGGPHHLKIEHKKIVVKPLASRYLEQPESVDIRATVLTINQWGEATLKYEKREEGVGYAEIQQDELALLLKNGAKIHLSLQSSDGEKWISITAAHAETSDFVYHSKYHYAFTLSIIGAGTDQAGDGIFSVSLTVRYELNGSLRRCDLVAKRCAMEKYDFLTE